MFEDIKKNPQYDSEVIKKAYDLARDAHKNQRRRSGEPYILHPLAVMGQVSSIDAKIVAIGHDLLEDTDATVEDLKSLGCSDQIIDAILALTKFKALYLFS
mgnify:CR=1 FL=1